jgi:DNA-directed RNA polymerase specialized sigma24 family protein
MDGAAAKDRVPCTVAVLDDDALRILLAQAAYQARRVVRTMGLDRSQREDVEQNIRLALLERRRYFGASRSPWIAFAHRVARQAAQVAADEIGAERRQQIEPLEDDIADLGQTATIVSPKSEDINLALSLKRVLACLSEDQRRLALLALDEDGDLAEAQRRAGLSTSTFYRILHEVRMRLRCADVVRLNERPQTSWENP